MAKNQTRKSISVSKRTYERLQAFVKAHGTSCSALVERVLAPILDGAPPMESVKEAPLAPVKEVVVATPVLEKQGHWEPRPAPVLKDPVKADLGDLASKIFTF
jgi:hypothetical protein